MAAFHRIAVPHKDILSGNFSNEIYAANLWHVYNKKGSDEYTDAKIFFEKTYLTKNLQSILDSVKMRLDGKGGGHFRSIATRFGGGKTHTLIALYHKCAEWGTIPVVVVGNELDVQTQTIWGAIEEQLTGSTKRLSGQTPRGSEALRKVLEEQDKPVLILIDELLQYITKAEAVKINDTTLAMLTIAFVQELSEAVSNLQNVCVVVTLPSSRNEQFDDERFAILDDKLRKVAGRTRDTVTPVSDMDIPRIIRQRLFSSKDDEIRDRAEGIVKDFVDYCKDESLIPEGMQPSEYRDAFLGSYPFLPHVIDVLYHRWGTIPQFQRARGVLRLLSMVVGSLASSDKQFITLGDFDMNNNAIRQELIEYLDPQFNGVVAKDMAGDGSGAHKVDQMVPDQYRGMRLGTRAAAAIFMYSHSGGAVINGATETEIKRATCVRGIPAAQISEVLNLFRSNLFYLNEEGERYMFTKETNMLKLKVDVMDNLRQKDIEENLRDLVKRNVGHAKSIRTVIWPASPSDVEDSIHIKLAIMKENDYNLIKQIYDKAGESDRIYRNTIFFLTPSDSERGRFMKSLRSKMALERIKKDQGNLKDAKVDALEADLSEESRRLENLVREYYSKLYTPEQRGPDAGRIRPLPGTYNGIDRIVYDHLVDEGMVSTKIGPVALSSQYLSEGEMVETTDLYTTMLSTPGEIRPASKDVLANTISDGVRDGKFGLGSIENGTPKAKFFKEQASASFEPGEVLIHASLCKEKQEQTRHEDGDIGGHRGRSKPHQPRSPQPSSSTIEYPINKDQDRLAFTFNVPEGQVNHISQILLNIASHYKDLRLRVEASDGSMSNHDVEMIREALRQIGAEYDGLP